MKSAVLSAVGIATVLLLWELAAVVVGIPLLVPSPQVVTSSAWTLLTSGELTRDIFASLNRLLVALAVGAPVGAIVGCAMGRWVAFDSALNPFVRMFNSIPAIALVPFSLMWFGVTELSRFSLLFYTISLTVLLSARQGMRSIPPLRLRAGAALGVTGADAFLRIVIPSCVPSIIIGVRTAIGLGVMVVVAAEMLGADSGLGYLIMESRSHFNVSNMAVGVIMLGFLSVVLDRLFQFSIETLLPRWSVSRRIR